MRVALILGLLLAGWTLVLLTAPAQGENAAGDAGSAREAPTTEKETIVIRADRAWEEPDGGAVLHFSGNFELISPDWELRADEADLHGPLDDPDRIVARGAPAYLTLSLIHI